MLSQNAITWIGEIMVHMRGLKGTNRDIQNYSMGPLVFDTVLFFFLVLHLILDGIRIGLRKW